MWTAIGWQPPRPRGSLGEPLFRTPSGTGYGEIIKPVRLMTWPPPTTLLAARCEFATARSSCGAPPAGGARSRRQGNPWQNGAGPSARKKKKNRWPAQDSPRAGLRWAPPSVVDGETWLLRSDGVPTDTTLRPPPTPTAWEYTKTRRRGWLSAGCEQAGRLETPGCLSALTDLVKWQVNSNCHWLPPGWGTAVGRRNAAYEGKECN